MYNQRDKVHTVGLVMWRESSTWMWFVGGRFVFGLGKKRFAFDGW